MFEIVDAEEQYQFCGQRSGGYVISIRISIASSEKLKWPHFLNFGGGGGHSVTTRSALFSVNLSLDINYIWLVQLQP